MKLNPKLSKRNFIRITLGSFFIFISGAFAGQIKETIKSCIRLASPFSPLKQKNNDPEIGYSPPFILAEWSQTLPFIK